MTCRDAWGGEGGVGVGDGGVNLATGTSVRLGVRGGWFLSGHFKESWRALLQSQYESPPFHT